MKRYDPILMMMVEDNATKVQDSTNSYFDVSYVIGSGPFQAIIVRANSDYEAYEKLKKKMPNANIIGARRLSLGEYESYKERGKPVLDAVKKNTTSVSLQGEGLIKHLMEVYGLDRKSAEKYAKEHKENGRDAAPYAKISEEAKAKGIAGKYGWISNISDLETALKDATRRGDKEGMAAIKVMLKKYKGQDAATVDASPESFSYDVSQVISKYYTWYKSKYGKYPDNQISINDASIKLQREILKSM